jgi:RNA 2',3'-cyclic 3'-phosphodiesterase
MAETIRTFIAIELPAPVRQFLADCQDRLRRARADVKWVRPDLIHLTLVFLGDVPAERQADLEAAVRSAVAGAGPMALQVTGAGRFPPRGLPRVVWVGVTDSSGSLVRFQRAVTEATTPFAQKIEGRDYTAHLTLGRVRSPKNSRDLEGMLDGMGGTTGPAFEARDVTIFRSDLSPQGPTYSALARIGLGNNKGSS